MSTIERTLHRLLPKGSSQTGDYSNCPAWPPDLFAVVATLVDRSGCYAEPRYTSPWSRSWLSRKNYYNEVLQTGKKWRNEVSQPPALAQRLWDVIVQRKAVDVCNGEQPIRVPAWWDVALKLMAIADEASAGVGFVDSARQSMLASFVAIDMTRLPNRRNQLPHLPFSLCILVPPGEACVQPKTRTPQLGCTLRSLSNNLALLPPIGEVRTNWLLGVHSRSTPERENRALNLLLVPFPYRIGGECFTGEIHEGTGKQPRRYRQGSWNFFKVRQDWLRGGVTAKSLTAYIVDLVNQSKREGGDVHGVVLPEGALDAHTATQVTYALARINGLEIFISGTASGPDRSQRNDDRHGNMVYSALFARRRILTYWQQSKHHRWRLDGSQIRAYQIDKALDPKKEWWEKIEVNNRRCWFYVFRHGASLATLVCEDLARVDPVQTVIRSVGPNLLIALLMDGPQMARRWPARYATVLAEDPGSAVLTLTSLGMVRRSYVSGDPEARQIALWKEAGGQTKELSLPCNSQALLIALTPSWEENFTLDGRSDNVGSLRLSLSDVRVITHPAPPRWAV